MSTQISICWTTFIVLMFLPVSLTSNGFEQVNVNDSVLLTCNKTCAGDVKWMLSNRAGLLVSKCTSGDCVEGPAFKNRTRPVQVGPSLHLNHVMYNDKGWYICYCDNSEICQFYLDVVFSSVKNVCVGATGILPCYAATDKTIPDDDIRVQWEKYGRPVVKLQQGKMSYGPGFEGRAFITTSQYKYGDLALTILNVQQSDRGIYQCKHRHEEPGQPEAITLSVSDCEAVKQSTLPWWEILLFVIASFCVVGLVIFYMYYESIFRCLKNKEYQAANDS